MWYQLGTSEVQRLEKWFSSKGFPRYLERIFKKYDKDGSGFVEGSEITAVVLELLDADDEDIPPLSKADIERVIAKHDNNDDQKLDLAEFSTLAKALIMEAAGQ